MKSSPTAGIILAMTRPMTSSKLLLVADPRSGSPERERTGVRRYRLARLRLDGRAADPAARFEHLKRIYD